MTSEPHAMSRALSYTASDGHGAPRRTAWTQRLLTVGWVLLLVLLVLVVLARWVASPIVAGMVNRKLANLKGYHGQVETVKIALWRGGVEANRFELLENGKEQHGPVVRFDEVDLRLAWAALLRGKVGGRLTIDRPQVDLRKTEPATPEDKKKAEDKLKEIEARMDPWQEALRNALPLELTRLEVNDGRIRFTDTSRQPNAEFALDHLHLVLTGLRNRPNGDPLPAKLSLEAATSGSGRLQVSVQADPLADAPRFATTMQVQHLDLTGMNPFLAAYSGVDVARGTFEFYLEAEAKDGAYHGYGKPFFKDLQFKSARDKNDSLGKKIKETAADVVSSVLKNDKDQKVATKAPFSGTFAQNDVDVWTAVDLLLRNAFVQALREGFDRPLGGP